MSEFLTRYPRRINLLKGLSEFIQHEEIQFDQLESHGKDKERRIDKYIVCGRIQKSKV